MFKFYDYVVMLNLFQHPVFLFPDVTESAAHNVLIYDSARVLLLAWYPTPPVRPELVEGLNGYHSRKIAEERISSSFSNVFMGNLKNLVILNPESNSGQACFRVSFLITFRPEAQNLRSHT